MSATPNPEQASSTVTHLESAGRSLDRAPQGGTALQPTAEPEAEFKALCDMLVAAGALTRTAADHLAPPQKMASIVPRLVNEEGVDPLAVAEAVARRLDMPRYDDSVHGAPDSRQADWLLAAGIAFLFNPYGPRMRLLAEEGTAGGERIAEFGVAALTQLDESGALAELDATQGIDTLLHQLFTAALAEGCSDIHLDPYADGEARAYFRRDGRLKFRTHVQREEYLNLANMLLEKTHNAGGVYGTPVDGQFAWELGQRKINVRLAMAPVRVGVETIPKFVLRLLGQDLDLRDLDRLRMDADQVRVIRGLARRANGLLLVTGPTGSGKTTTLFALLRDMQKHSPDKAYYTLEDPVEIEVPGINQIQVNRDRGLTFASGLRHVLRLDPDVIFVGEIRDRETAELAVRAALTGHLVFSTLHTTSALGAIPRLLDLGVNTTLLSDSLMAATAQRMVRRVCPRCATASAFGEHNDTMARYAKLPGAPRASEPVRVADPQGCAHCKHGYLGRRVVSELVVIDATLAGLIASNAPLSKLQRHTHTYQVPELWASAIRLIRDGVTTLEEAEHVLGPLLGDSESTSYHSNDEGVFP